MAHNSEFVKRFHTGTGNLRLPKHFQWRKCVLRSPRQLDAGDSFFYRGVHGGFAIRSDLGEADYGAIRNSVAAAITDRVGFHGHLFSVRLRLDPQVAGVGCDLPNHTNL